MSKLALVYGMRLFPADDIAAVDSAVITLKNGKKANITLHLLEGEASTIEQQLRSSIEAFFEFYPEI